MVKKIKVSHESPLCYMDYIEEFQDYFYALPHLLMQNNEYSQKFARYKREGKEIYMDNSLHELGYSMDDQSLQFWLAALRPSNFFVPDAWEDKTKSVINAKKWIHIEIPEETTKIAVIQATTLHEAFECVQIYKDLGYKKIAFPYGSSYYNDICPHPNKDIGKALGRVYVITTLYAQGILKPTDRVHLLGCAVPSEFIMYKGIECIESIDTSNPVMFAIEGVGYHQHEKLFKKPQTNLNSCFDMGLDEKVFENLYYNLNQFKNLI